MPFIVTAPAIKGLRHTSARNDLFRAHKEIVLAARTRRLTDSHMAQAVVGGAARDVGEGGIMR